MKKIIILMMILLSISSFNVFSENIYCYQNLVNVDYGCGNLDTGNYSTNFYNSVANNRTIDGNFYTSSMLSLLNQFYNVTYKYNISKVINYTDSKFIYYSYYPTNTTPLTLNFTLDKDYFNNDTGILIFRIYEQSGGATLYFYNFSSNSDSQVYTGTVRGIFEMAMNWSFTGEILGESNLTIIPDIETESIISNDSNNVAIVINVTGEYIENFANVTLDVYSLGGGLYYTNTSYELNTIFTLLNVTNGNYTYNTTIFNLNGNSNTTEHNFTMEYTTGNETEPPGNIITGDSVAELNNYVGVGIFILIILGVLTLLIPEIALYTGFCAVLVVLGMLVTIIF